MSLNEQFFRKETRELVWYWVASVVVFVVSVSISLTSANREVGQTSTGLVFGFAIFTGYVLTHAIATYPFSSEFANNTMPRLLAQPVPRVQIWNRKILLVLACLTVLLVIELAAIVAFRNRLSNLDTSNRIMALGIVSAFFSGPLMAILIRQGLTALLASMIMPFGFALSGMLIGILCDYMFHMNPAEEGSRLLNVPVFWWILGLAWCASSHMFARYQFLRLEV